MQETSRVFSKPPASLCFVSELFLRPFHSPVWCGPVWRSHKWLHQASDKGHLYVDRQKSKNKADLAKQTGSNGQSLFSPVIRGIFGSFVVTHFPSCYPVPQLETDEIAVSCRRREDCRVERRSSIAQSGSLRRRRLCRTPSLRI